MPAISELKTALRVWEDRAPGLFVSDAEPGFLAVGAGDRPVVLRMSIHEHGDDKPYEVSTPTWHGHFDSADEACEAAMSLIGGGSRVAREYRGETLSATWREVWDGVAYEMLDTAIFLNPMDSTEWKLWPGESWRVARSHMRLLDLAPFLALPTTLPQIGTTLEFDVEPELPYVLMKGTNMPGWLAGSYGPAEEGMRWTFGPHNALALQVPIGWRSQKQAPPDNRHVRFEPYEMGVFLYVTCYWRPDSVGEPVVQERTALLPDNVEHEFHPTCSTNAEFAVDQWVVSFASGDVDLMKAVIYLYQSHDDGRNLDDVKSKLHETLWKSRYVIE